MVEQKPKDELEQIRVRVLQTAEDYLYHNKTPKYPSFFRKWATRTVDGDYLRDLIEAEVSATARTMLLDQIVKTNPYYIWYWQGYAAGILRVSEVIRSKAQKKIIQEELEDGTDENDVIG